MAFLKGIKLKSLKGFADSPVPNVVGLTQINAQMALNAAGLTVGAISQAPSSTVASGSVISQSSGVGTTLPQGTAVNLTISTGMQPILLTPTQAMANMSLFLRDAVNGVVQGRYQNNPVTVSVNVDPTNYSALQTVATGGQEMAGAYAIQMAGGQIVSENPPIITVKIPVARLMTLAQNGMVRGISETASTAMELQSGSTITPAPVSVPVSTPTVARPRIIPIQVIKDTAKKAVSGLSWSSPTVWIAGVGILGIAGFFYLSGRMRRK